MMEYLKYLPLLKVLADHPALVALFQQLSTAVGPHIPEINQALAEAEAILQRANTVRMETPNASSS